MKAPSAAGLAEAVERGLAAVEAEDLEAAEQALDEAERLGGENHALVLHLAGMLAWARGDLDRATGFLMQAADLDPDHPEIHLDCAECLFAIGEDLDEAEAAVRVALALPTISGQHAEEARLLLAQIRLADDDAAEALEILDLISPELHGHPAFLSTSGAVLLAAGRHDDAIAALERAVALEPDDPDLHYQLGITRQAAGDENGARASMVRVLELDSADAPPEPLSYAEVQDLRSVLEDVLEELPDPLIRLVASAPITVQARATPQQVARGVDPRSPVAFAGVAAEGEVAADFEGIVVMRDPLVEESGDGEDEIAATLFYAVLEEIRRFFGREDLILVSAGQKG
jgi:tetratricopeptide (TPR) repeat protein